MESKQHQRNTLAVTQGFVWGAATAAYQIEGAAAHGGRTPSIWDTFARTPGKTFNGDTGDDACRHYELVETDLELMDWLGIDAYRYSVSWSRLLPNGVGEPNPEAINFYNRLIDGLLERGIQPWLTMYHWDLPQVLHDRGGWQSRQSIEWFGHYAQTLVNLFGDRIKNWITINEPHCVAWFGYYRGWFAPGITDLQASIDVSHHLLLAHGRAVRIVKDSDPTAQVGISLGLTPVEAASGSPEDIAAATRQDGYDLRWFLDPLHGRGYPQDIVQQLGVEVPVVDDDLDVIATATDFLGVNFYLRQIVKAAPADGFLDLEGIDPEGATFTDTGWEVYPAGLRNLCERLHSDYSPAALYITENGSAWLDVVTAVGEIEDHERVDYLRQHLDAVSEIVDAGIPLKGYFAWSLLDNFEWNSGYGKRFGLFYVDYTTFHRTPKLSASWFRNYISKSRD